MLTYKSGIKLFPYHMIGLTWDMSLILCGNQGAYLKFVLYCRLPSSFITFIFRRPVSFYSKGVEGCINTRTRLPPLPDSCSAKWLNPTYLPNMSIENFIVSFFLTFVYLGYCYIIPKLITQSAANLQKIFLIIFFSNISYIRKKDLT
jgi:hypothetical protein